MATNYGFSGLKNNQSTSETSGITSQLSILSERVLGVRVTDIILDDTHPKFEKYGEWNGIGTIEFEKTDEPNSSFNSNNALPLLPHLASYPLVNEIVLIFSLPNREQSKSLNQPVQYYYLNSINIWNHPHHNALPNPLLNIEESSPQEDVDYEQMENGVSRKNSSKPFELNLNPPSGGNFVEKSNIHPLLPFIGDNIFEGRYGNSIRLGNTSKSKSLYNNNWSLTGENGDPITILRNGQNPELTGSALSLTVEDINKDLSSAYFTSTQNLPIEVSSKNDYLSYGENQPTDPKDYNGAQIILNSGRLVFNTTQDHIMLSSKKSINLNSIEGVNVDTIGPVVIEAPEIKLGSNDAEESVLLGDSTVDLLQSLISDLSSLTKIMGSQIGNNGILLEPMGTTARTISNNLDTYQTQLDSLKSNIVKVE